MRPDPTRRPPAEVARDRAPSTNDLAGSYRPRRVRDFIFLHGMALAAARRAIREGPSLHVPREWEERGKGSEERRP